MKIYLVTPAAKGSLSGNRVTANRWARILRQLGHRVQVATHFDGSKADILIAIHAWRSASAVAQFRCAQPGKRVVVLLAGTDVYDSQYADPETTFGCMDSADCLVGLHDLVGDDIPTRYRDRLSVIHQSTPPWRLDRKPVSRWFQVCVVGHLRDAKDSLRAATAARHLPAASRIRVVSLGAAHTEDWARAAEMEMSQNPRFRWRGEVARSEVRRCFARSHVMVISSVMEGGANVVSEALVAGLPIIASEISGNVGLMGRSHPGYYPPKDDAALAGLLRRCETDTAYLERLTDAGNQRAHLFTPEREALAWKTLIETL